MSIESPRLGASLMITETFFAKPGGGGAPPGNFFRKIRLGSIFKRRKRDAVHSLVAGRAVVFDSGFVVVWNFLILRLSLRLCEIISGFLEIKRRACRWSFH